MILCMCVCLSVFVRMIKPKRLKLSSAAILLTRIVHRNLYLADVVEARWHDSSVCVKLRARHQFCFRSDDVLAVNIHQLHYMMVRWTWTNRSDVCCTVDRSYGSGECYAIYLLSIIWQRPKWMLSLLPVDLLVLRRRKSTRTRCYWVMLLLQPFVLIISFVLRRCLIAFQVMFSLLLDGLFVCLLTITQFCYLSTLRDRAIVDNRITQKVADKCSGFFLEE